MTDDRRDQGDEQTELPASVAAFVRALNSGDHRALLETFAERALVNDEGRDCTNKAAVDAWAARVVLEQRLRIEPRALIILRTEPEAVAY